MGLRKFHALLVENVFEPDTFSRGRDVIARFNKVFSHIISHGVRYLMVNGRKCYLSRCFPVMICENGYCYALQ